MAQVISLSAWFWTLSRACWLVFDVVDHAVEPHSRWGLTVPWYTVFSIFSLAPQVVPASLLRTASLRLALASTLTMCCFQVCLLSNVTPRYVVSSSSLSGVPPRMMVPAVLLWGQGEQGGGRLVLVDGNTPFLCPAVEFASRQPHPVCVCSCVFFLAPHHQVICI